MTYKIFVIDIFNLAYKLQTKIATPIDIANNVINYINDEVKSRLDPDGDIYLCFDPIPKSDLNTEKNFKYTTERQSISKEYKANREQNPIVYSGLKLLRKYYVYRGEHLKVCISNEFEADDYVEGIIKNNPGVMTALITTDLDWARYISDNVHMINKGFDKPLTREEFFKERGYLPTIAAVTLSKAIFGDVSDNIPAVLTKKNKIYIDNDAFIKALIKKMSENNDSIEEVFDTIKNFNTIQLHLIENKTELQEILSIISTSENAWDAFLDNMRIIKCRCEDVKKHTFWHEDNPSYNKLMESTLNRVSLNKKPFNFGNIKLK